MKKIYLLVLAIVMLISCNIKNSNQVQQKVKPYFDVESFVKKQIDLLSKKNAVISKEVVLNGQTETKTIENINWEKELQLFLEVDINKPVLVGSYEIIKEQDKTIYKAKEETLKIQQIIIQKSGENIKNLEIFVKEENALFHFSKKLTMVMNASNTIEQIHIEGVKDVSMMKEVHFVIHEKIS